MNTSSTFGNKDAFVHAPWAGELLGEEADAAVDAIVRVAGQLCGADASFIALLDRDRQFALASHWGNAAGTPTPVSLLSHAILDPGELFEVYDCASDPCFSDALQTPDDTGFGSFAAQPLTTQEGLVVGALCVACKQPKSLDQFQHTTLKELSSVAVSIFERRKLALASERLLREARDTSLAALEKLMQRKSDLDIKNQQFNAALDNMMQGLCMFDKDQRLIVCNRPYAEMHKLPPELTRPGTTLSQIVQHRVGQGVYAGADRESYIRERAEWVSNPREESTIHHLNDGRSIAIARKPLPDGGWVTTHEDITELITARKELEKLNDRIAEEKDRFRSLYRDTPVMMHSIDETGTIVDASAYWSEVLGYTPEEVVGRKSIEFMTDETRKYAEEVVLPAFWRDGSCREIAYQMVCKDGAVIDVKLSAVVSSDFADGSPRSLACVIDVTDQVRAERELIQHRDHLQELVDAATADLKAKAEELETALAREKELNELQRQFVSMASHEFRTPLAIIDSTAQRLKRATAGKVSGDVTRRVDKIRGAVDRMTRLMESTLTAARLEDGKVEVQTEPCNIWKVLSDVCARQREIARNHNISCTTHGLPQTIKADTGAIDQVLTNLLSNAVKYSPYSPEIEIEALREGDWVVIHVRDHGLGIDAEDLPNMFSRFFRAKTSSGIAGTGIGLNLVKTLVEMHGGSVAVESKKGEGSTFTIRLPIDGPAHSSKVA